MDQKEIDAQVALGTLDIPELIPIDLSKVDKDNNTHPDIKEDKQYLVRIERVYLIGYIDPYNLEFYTDTCVENIGSCEAIWLIKTKEN